MSGHSKWSTIRRAKEAKDFKKGQTYTKLTKQIIDAARSGDDPGLNFKLRMAIQKAKEANMSSDTIQNAIKKGAGKDVNAALYEQVEYEAYGPGGSMILIDALTDNRNRTVSNLRTILEKNGGTFVSAGAISWQFKVYGNIVIRMSTPDNSKESAWNKVTKQAIAGREDEFELEMLEIEGVLDIGYENELAYILTAADKLDSVRKYCEQANYEIVSAELIKVPNETVKVDDDTDDKVHHLVSLLEEDEDVENIWINI